MGDRPRRRGGSRGFTLVELIVVLGVISVLMGVGIGFLQSGGTDMDVALMVVRDQVRLASTTAKSRSLPTSVHIVEDDEAQRVRVYVMGLRNVGFWHFEDGERWFDHRMTPILTGSSVPGRFGMARRPDPEEGAAAMRVAANNEAFDFDVGFAFRVEVKLEARAPMTVARLGNTFSLSLQNGLRPQGKVMLAGVGTTSGGSVTIKAQNPLPTGRWITLELVHDGSYLTLLVDGEEEARRKAGGAPFRRPNDELEVSSASSPVHGLIDEVQLLAFERGDEMELPFGVEWTGVPGPIRFGRRGQLLEPKPARIGLSRAVGSEEEAETVERWVAPGGVLQ